MPFSEDISAQLGLESESTLDSANRTLASPDFQEDTAIGFKRVKAVLDNGYRYFDSLCLPGTPTDGVFIVVSPCTLDGDGLVRKRAHMTELYQINNFETLSCSKFNHFGHHNYHISGDYDWDDNNVPRVRQLSRVPRDDNEIPLFVRAIRVPSVKNNFGVVRYSLDLDKDGYVEVGQGSKFAFAGLWCFGSPFKNCIDYPSYWEEEVDITDGGVEIYGDFHLSLASDKVP